MSETNSNEIIEIKTKFAKDYFLVLIILVILQLSLIGVLSFYIFVQVTNAIPDPLYFNITENEQIIEPIELKKPSLTNAAILNLVNEAVNLSYTFNYRNLVQQVDLVKYYFDERGLKTYIKVLQKDPNMKKVVSRKLIVSAEALKAPQVVREGLFQGRYTWRVQMPLLVYYQNKEIVIRRETDIDLIMWRVPETESSNGVKITTFKSKFKSTFETKADETF